MVDTKNSLTHILKVSAPVTFSKSVPQYIYCVKCPSMFDIVNLGTHYWTIRAFFFVYIFTMQKNLTMRRVRLRKGYEIFYVENQFNIQYA